MKFKINRIFVITIIIISFLILFYLYLRDTAQYDIIHSSHFDDYMKSIKEIHYSDKIEDIEKYNIKTKTDFINTYISFLKKPDKKYDSFLNKAVIRAKNILSNNGLQNISKGDWYIIMSKDGLEGNKQFTLGNFIVFNETFIERMYKTNNIKQFVIVLLHERLHIIQRNNQELFNTHYRENYKFLNKNILLNKYPEKIMDKMVINPDNNSTMWIYNINNQIVYPNFELDNVSYKEVGYVLKDDIIIRKFDLESFKHSLGYDDRISFTHPNEIFASSISYKLYDNNLSINDKQFLNTL